MTASQATLPAADFLNEHVLGPLIFGQVSEAY